jgi:ABC-type branched-subunit amino acid transport system substrate-binding protein
VILASVGAGVGPGTTGLGEQVVAGEPKVANGRRRRRLAVLPVLVALSLTAACGARWSDAEREGVLARANGRGTTEQASAGSGGTTTTIAGATDAGSTSAGGTAGTTGGTAGGTTTGGTTGGGASGPRPCAAASNAPGVSATTITVGNISTISGPVPGLGTPSVSGVRAYLAYRNSLGGVCGRKLVLKAADDGLENLRYRSALTEMNTSTLGLVGGFAGGDAGALDVLASGNIPAVLNAFNDGMQDAPTAFDINPPFAKVDAITAKYKYLYDQGVRTASVATIAQASSLSELNQQVARMEAVGIKVIHRQELPLSTLSFDAPARAVANSGADYFIFLGALNLNSSMARSLHDTGYKLKFEEFLTAYGSTFIGDAGPGAEGVTSWTRSLPVEDGTGNPQMKAFLEWMGRAAPGIATDTFAADSWAAAKAFFDSLEALPGPITRAALIAQLKTLTNYDADGFYGPINLGAKQARGCSVAMKVVNGKWTRLYPSSGYAC